MKITAALKKRRGLRLTAMIDIIFLLLIFFILVTRFQHQQSLPLVVQESTATTATATLTITLKDSNTLMIDDQSLTISELSGYLNRPGRENILLVAGDKVPLQALLTVMDIIRGAGFQHITVQAP